MLYRPRRGLLGLPPGVLRARPETIVRLGQSRMAVTDFGLERLMQRTLDALKRAGPQARVRYLGRVRIDDLPQPVLGFDVRVPRQISDPPTMALYIDPRRELPCGAVLRSSDGTLVGAYFYRDLRTDIALTDDDFVIRDEPHAAASRSTP